MVAKSLGRALALLSFFPPAVFALGLGEIRLNSALNAPLEAEVELVGATPEELASLQPQLASRDTFNRYGLEWPTVLNNVTLRSLRTPDGRQVVQLRTAEPVTEPFLTLLIEVSWARGRLLREYTMLLDPPVYTPGASGAPQVAGAVSGSSAREGTIARPAEEAAVPVASQAAASAPTQAAQAAGAPAPAARTPAAGGGTYAVRRGDTLSAIAAEYAPPERTEVRRWMVATYRANPNAFEGNMNLLRAGAILRVPDQGAIASIDPNDAVNEVRSQYQAWNAANAAAAAGAGGQATAQASESGRLRLVPPAQPGGSVPAPESAGAGSSLDNRVRELEAQLQESRRLLELRNAELAQLQARTGAAGQLPVAEPPATPAAPEAAAPAESTPEAQPAPSPSEPAVAEPVTPPAAAPVAAIEEEAGPSLIDRLVGMWWVLALVLVAIVGAMAFRSWRARQESDDFDESIGRLAGSGTGFATRDPLSDTASLRQPSPAVRDSDIVVEESGPHARPRIPDSDVPAPVRAARNVTTDDTISSESAINLEQGDPLAEADFHMAYGLYDQAADLVRIAIAREPERRELKLKLLEVFFVWGNKEQFLQTAHELAGSRADAGPGEWEKIVIMGKQLAPEDQLFASSGAALGGAAAAGVDLDLEAGVSPIDFDVLSETSEKNAGSAGGIDFDLGTASTAESPTIETATDENFALDPMDAGLTMRATAEMPGFGEQGNEPTVEQPALDARGAGPMRKKVEIALRHGGGSEQTAELAIDDLGLDLGGLDTIDQPGLGASSDAPTLVAGLDERSRRAMRGGAASRADLDATMPPQRIGNFDESPTDTAATAQMPSYGETAQMPAFGDQHVDFDLGDSSDSDANGSGGLDLDVGSAPAPAGGYTVTQKLGAEELALPDLEPVTMSEVGTKLDLARAYMDMGDPEGARNILEEVLQEGSHAQKQEAQRLLEALPG